MRMASAMIVRIGGRPRACGRMVAWFRDVARRREGKKFHQGHHTGIGTRVAGTVLSHEQQFQSLPSVPFDVSA